MELDRRHDHAALANRSAHVPYDSLVRRDLLFMARVAEQAERYDDMIGYVTRMVEVADSELSMGERNTFACAFKNAVGGRRASWRIVASCKQKAARGGPIHVDTVQAFAAGVEDELIHLCEDGIGLLDEFLLPKTRSNDSHVFFLKMKGDFYRYIAEVLEPHEREDDIASAVASYQEAYDLGRTTLAPTSTTFLGLSLNFAVFYFEMLEDAVSAHRLARKTFEDAMRNLDQATDDTYGDATMVLQLLRDNMTLWVSDLEDRGETSL